MWRCVIRFIFKEKAVFNRHGHSCDVINRFIIYSCNMMLLRNIHDTNINVLHCAQYKFIVITTLDLTIMSYSNWQGLQSSPFVVGFNLQNVAYKAIKLAKKQPDFNHSQRQDITISHGNTYHGYCRKCIINQAGTLQYVWTKIQSIFMKPDSRVAFLMPLFAPMHWSKMYSHNGLAKTVTVWIRQISLKHNCVTV